MSFFAGAPDLLRSSKSESPRSKAPFFKYALAIEGTRRTFAEFVVIYDILRTVLAAKRSLRLPTRPYLRQDRTRLLRPL